MIGVIGAAQPSPQGLALAESVGREIARRGAVLVCGGLGGVMEAAARGAFEAGGEVVGVLPGPESASANPFVTIAIATNMGHARNVIIAQTAEALIAVEGEYGTLSETAIGLKLGKPVVVLPGARAVAGTQFAESADSAVSIAFESLNK
ncbi:MAG: TIGR00725 family protein [Desulfuromonadales bacterium]|jgi:hypothetical protein